MNDVKTDLSRTAAFRLGTLGAVVADRFAAEIAPFDLKPKHVGLLNVLSQDSAASQQVLAAKLGVVPSLVVALADHLEDLGALTRVRDSRDRRRQVLTLTEEGKHLLSRCTEIAKKLDQQLLAPLSAPQRKGLHDALRVLAASSSAND